MASKPEKKEDPFWQQYLTPIQYAILERLKEIGPMTRDQLCEDFGFGKHKVEYIIHPNRVQRETLQHISLEQYNRRTTIYDNLVKLKKRKLVEKFTRSNGKRGRPCVYWKIKN